MKQPVQIMTVATAGSPHSHASGIEFADFRLPGSRGATLHDPDMIYGQYGERMLKAH